ncbi:MAG: hypothetical protein E6Q36_01745 [Chryseobacterium sp.]|nr:MAG: hypothetical protein E6Q36_01745 [Chryseobacterium sp.]
MTIEEFTFQNLWWFSLLFIWSLAWKGWALWIAAHKNQKVWFIVFLIVNTLGILEIFYIFYFSKQTSVKTAPKK